jgi:plasmid stabilization system protein ParE
VRARFSPKAKQQLLEIVTYVARDNLCAARRFRDRVRCALEVASRFPDAGRAIPEARDSGIREIIVAPYRILYRRERNGVVAVSLWHGARRRPVHRDGSLR